jgi:hypothetical protein
MTTSNTQFVSKEHYLAFRKKWSNAVNSEKAKPHDEVRVYTYKGSREEYTARVDGWLTSAHHVLYNILRNRPFHKGFTMINKPSKIMGGHMPHLGLYQAVGELKNIIKLINQEAEYIDPVKNEARIQRMMATFKRKREKVDKEFWGTSRIDEFLAPFDGTVSREMLLAIDLPKVEALYNDYGKGRKVSQKICSGEAQPRTYDDLLTLIEEVA